MDLYKFHKKPEILHKHSNADNVVPSRLEKLIRSGTKINDKQEDSIAKVANLSVLYARRMHKRFTKGEPVIMKDPYLAQIYAQEVIKGEWPEAEKYIATDPVSSIDYAIFVSKHRFPEAEKTILKNENAHDILNYVEYVLKKRWPEAEKILLKKNDIHSIMTYVRTILQDRQERWPEAEDIIIKTPENALEYAISVIKKEWPKGEDIIATSGRNTLRYSVFINKRFKKGEPSLHGYDKERYEKQWGITL